MPATLCLSVRRVLVAVAACAIPTVFAADVPPTVTPAPVTVIKAGKLIDVATGRVRNDQVIVVQGGKISAVTAAVVDDGDRKSQQINSSSLPLAARRCCPA